MLALPTSGAARERIKFRLNLPKPRHSTRRRNPTAKTGPDWLFEEIWPIDGDVLERNILKSLSK